MPNDPQLDLILFDLEVTLVDFLRSAPRVMLE